MGKNKENSNTGEQPICSSGGLFKEGSWEMEIPDNILYIHMDTYLSLTISVLSGLNFTPQCVSHISAIICLQTKKAETWGT